MISANQKPFVKNAADESQIKYAQHYLEKADKVIIESSPINYNQPLIKELLK